ncbi:MAG: YgjP-like metallopeptidase domain-containing protein [Candidatus Doudnabacteria bacterium]
MVNYEIKTSFRARHLRIVVYPGGRVVVTKPERISVARAEQFVKSKSSWIKKNIAKLQNKKAIPTHTLSKHQVLEFVRSRVDIYNRYYNFSLNKISIKDHKSLWGSCSRRRNLNFNQRIASLPLNQADYIIVHELCHLKEFNHSVVFWALVAQTIPDYKLIKKELRKYSFGLDE